MDEEGACRGAVHFRGGRRSRRCIEGWCACAHVDVQYSCRGDSAPPPLRLSISSLCEFDSLTSVCCTAQHLQRCRRACGPGRIIAHTVHAGAGSARALPLPAKAPLFCFQTYPDARWPAARAYSTPQRALPLPPAPLLHLPFCACIYAPAHRYTLQHPRTHVHVRVFCAAGFSQSQRGCSPILQLKWFSCWTWSSIVLSPALKLARTDTHRCTAATTFCSSLPVHSVHHSCQTSTHPHAQAHAHELTNTVDLVLVGLCYPAATILTCLSLPLQTSL